MDTTPQTSLVTEPAISAGRVRTDVVAGAGVIATVILGHALWTASDAGILAALGAR